jgi:hypothetical protein
VSEPLFEGEQARGLTSGLPRDLITKLVEWEKRARRPGERALRRAEVVFRGKPMFVAEFLDAGTERGLTISRAMAESWEDAVRNGFGIVLSEERLGPDPLVSCRPSLELWLRWQEDARVRG